jgi:hypothetical protein
MIRQEKAHAYLSKEAGFAYDALIPIFNLTSHMVLGWSDGQQAANAVNSLLGKSRDVLNTYRRHIQVVLLREGDVTGPEGLGIMDDLFRDQQHVLKAMAKATAALDQCVASMCGSAELPRDLLEQIQLLRAAVVKFLRVTAALEREVERIANGK